MNIGFIGGGALTEAIVSGIANTVISSTNIFVSDHKQARCKELARNYNINAFVGTDFFLDGIDVMIIAVKPKDVIAALREITPISNNAIIVSVVAGLSIGAIESIFTKQSVFRAMPNVAISVGEGMTALAPGQRADQGDIKIVSKIFSSIGRCRIVDERLMDAVTGLSGSGPAFAFMMIDALSDGGVAAGLPRATAVELAAQTLLGAAKMVLRTGSHPDVLRDRVTSPAGTTIEGVRVLERGGVRSALIEAVLAATEKSKSLGKS